MRRTKNLPSIIRRLARFSVLQAHEEHHTEIGSSWVPIFQQRLLGKAKNKFELEHNKVLASFIKAVKKYDDKTKHGQTEGVSLHWQGNNVRLMSS